MKKYKQHMQHTLNLAVQGWGRTSPNPMVGALVLKNGKVVGEGFHETVGKDHAEVMAIKSAGKKTKGSELVVNLEPCGHHGRTPPCTDVIINSGIKKVIYGMKDPNPQVNGRGLKKLKAAGIEVVGPVLKKECESLNRIYVHNIKAGLPYVVAKIALSLDGKIATEKGSSKWITNEKCRTRVHYWRAGVDAVMVGAETVRQDNPKLDARGIGKVRQPRPVIVTATGKINLKNKIFSRRLKPVVICTNETACKKFEKAKIHVIRPKKKRGSIDWKDALAELYKFGISSVLVEGGAKVHSQLMKEKLADYMVATLAPKLVGARGKEWLPNFNVVNMSESPHIEPDQILVLDNNVIIEGRMIY